MTNYLRILDMTDIRYYFSVISYIYNGLTGDSLNIGVAVWTTEERNRRVHVHVTREWSRLHILDANADFRLLDRMESDIRRLIEMSEDISIALEPLYQSSFGVHMTPARGGVTENLDERLQMLIREYLKHR